MSERRAKRYALVDQTKCVACGCCVKVCKKGAIGVPCGVQAEVDEMVCVGCGLCAKACPASVITIQEVNEKRELKGGTRGEEEKMV